MKGEFEKRLDHYRKQHDNVRIQRKKYVRTTLNAMEGDIDEARKEWLEIPSIVQSTTNDMPEDLALSEKTRIIDNELAIEKQKWFEKWLGSE